MNTQSYSFEQHREYLAQVTHQTSDFPRFRSDPTMRGVSDEDIAYLEAKFSEIAEAHRRLNLSDRAPNVPGQESREPNVPGQGSRAMVLSFVDQCRYYKGMLSHYRQKRLGLEYVIVDQLIQQLDA